MNYQVWIKGQVHRVSPAPCFKGTKRQALAMLREIEWEEPRWKERLVVARTMSDNLMDGLFKQMNRCRELVKHYEEIGPVGAFGKAMILRDIERAELSIRSGDIAQMVSAYKALEGCK